MFKKEKHVKKQDICTFYALPAGYRSIISK